MKFAFALVALMVAVICTNDDYDVAAISIAAEDNNQQQHNGQHQLPKTTKIRETEERKAGSTSEKLQTIRDAETAYIEFLKALQRLRKNGHILTKRQMNPAPPNPMMPGMGMGMSSDSSGDSMSMSMSMSSSDAGGGMGGAPGMTGRTNTRRNPLLSQLEPELMLTGEMLRRLEEQTLGYSISSGTSLNLRKSGRLQSLVACLFSATITYLLFAV